jgi:cytosine deaminase
MSHAIFAGSLPTKENSIVTTRRNSRTGSVSFIHRPSVVTGSISHTHVHEAFMNEALNEARASLAEGGIPIGCVLVRHGQVIARGHNCRIQRNSAILHAEMDCLEAAGRQPVSFYQDCTLYTTVSPCAMSAGAIRFYGIPRVVIGENKTFHGDEILLRASNVQIDVLDSKECHKILASYIKENPIIWNENIGHEIH